MEMLLYASFALNVLAILQLARQGYIRPRALVIYKSRRASSPTGLLPGAVSPVDFAIHCALYARGWGAGYKLSIERLDNNQHMHEPCHLKVMAEYIQMLASDGTMTVKRYAFDVYADQYTVKAIFHAALAKLIDGEDVEEVVLEMSKGG